MGNKTHTKSKPTRIARADRARGFTLVETAIALLVMLVAGLAAASLFLYSIKYNTGATDRALAQAIAQHQMEELRKTPFAQLDSSTQDVTSAGRPFNVVTTVCNDGSAACGGSTAMKRITVQVGPRSAGPSWTRSSVVLVSMRTDVSTGPYF